jgi:hypothetical protein
MRRPEIASARKRSQDRLRLKKRPGMPRPRRRKPPQVPLTGPAVAPARTETCPQTPAVSETAPSGGSEVIARESLRCGFGAVRVGALLGRLRLHLQTDRFLAVHRGDALWEEGCLAAAFALADVVAGMQEPELDALLARDPQVPGSVGQGSASGLAPSESVGRPFETPLETRDKHGKPELQAFRPGLYKGLGARKIGTITLARCSAELARGGR